MSSQSPPPTLAVGAAYDTLLQSALLQFFERATLDTEMTPSVSSDGRLRSSHPQIRSAHRPVVRHPLHPAGSGRWVFTAHEVRLAQAIGAVLAARFSAILNPRIIAERGDLFRGAIEDRYVGAFLDKRSYAIEARAARADRVASIIELLGLPPSRATKTGRFPPGVLLLGTSDPLIPAALVHRRRLRTPSR